LDLLIVDVPFSAYVFGVWNSQMAGEENVPVRATVLYATTALFVNRPVSVIGSVKLSDVCVCFDLLG
jgi:hypothetical protein